MPWMRGLALGLFVAAYLGAVGLAARQSSHELQGAQDELSEAIPAARKVVEANAVIVARKGVVAHYVGSQSMFLPEVDNLEEMHGVLRREDHGQPLYLYFGSIERQFRPELAILEKSADAPPWLRPVAQGTANSWVLYQYKP
jgi:hypothetical protein